MISGKTTLIAHIGYPTETFKAPLIYNPWFDAHGIDAIVVPMGVKAEDYPSTLRAVFKMTNIGGALITMPHKVTTGTPISSASIVPGGGLRSPVICSIAHPQALLTSSSVGASAW